MDDSDDFDSDPFNYSGAKRIKVQSSQAKNKTRSKLQLKNKENTRKNPTKKFVKTKRLAGTQVAAATKPRPTNSYFQSATQQTDISGFKGNRSNAPVLIRCFALLLTPCLYAACPSCQVPLHLLGRAGQVSARVHVADCDPDAAATRVECPHGAACDSNVVAHYARYGHPLVPVTPDLPSPRPRPLFTSTTTSVSGRANGGKSPQPSQKRRCPSPIIAVRRSGSVSGQSQARGSAAPVSQSRQPWCSPDKADRRPSTQKTLLSSKSETCKKCGNVFEGRSDLLDNHLCIARLDSTVDTHSNSQSSSPLIGTERQRKFLNGLGQVADDNVRRNVPERLTFSQEDMFNDSMNSRIEGAIKNLESTERLNPDDVNDDVDVGGKSNREKVFVNGKVHDISLEPSEPDDENVGRADDVSKPIRITGCQKDSQSEELEVSMRIDPGVHCTGVRLRVPLKRSSSGQERPVEVSANYTNIASPSPAKSPAKQATITDFYSSPTKTSKSGETKSENSSNANGAKKRWDEIFSKPGPSKKGYIVAEYNSQSSQEREKAKGKESKKAPFYKFISGTNLAVDAFNFGDLKGVKYYLLSHFHYDHYIGLNKSWKQLIVCSSITKRLLVFKLKVSEGVIRTLDPGQTKRLGDCVVTAVDANHCPGAVMFVIKLTSGATILHTGDFRAVPEMEECPEFWNLSVDKLYLDTTYCKPDYDFPSQSDVIHRTVELVREFLQRKPKTVVLVGAYAIGKERIFKAVVESLNCKLWGDNTRVDTWRCLEDGDILSRLVGDRKRAQVHVINNGLVNYPKLGQEFEKFSAGSPWEHVLGVKPTGWSHSLGESAEASLVSLEAVTRGKVSLLEVPYSEHSSYGEMRRFVRFLGIRDVGSIIDTVSGGRTKNIFRQWIEENNGGAISQNNK